MFSRAIARTFTTVSRPHHSGLPTRLPLPPTPYSPSSSSRRSFHDSRFPPTTPAQSSSSHHPSALPPHKPRSNLLGISLTTLTAVALVSYLILEPVNAESPSFPSSVARKQPSGQSLIPYDEVQRHNTPDDCWVIISGNVYDVTEFLENHPGGARVIIKNSGKDATSLYMPIHPPGTIENSLPEEKCIGPVDPLTLPNEAMEVTPDQKRVDEARANMPKLGAMINLYDFEELAAKVLSTTAWAYYSSGADDMRTVHENENAFHRYWFRPRILRDVTTADISTTILGCPSSAPFFIAPAAMARLGHPDGEMNLTRGAGAEGIIQIISANASCSLDEITNAKTTSTQPLFYQLYLDWDREKSKAMVDKVDQQYGVKAIFVTVDSAATGNRERDQRAKGDFDDDDDSSSGKGVANAISGYQAANMTWSDITWIKQRTSLPIVIKGIQSVEDVLLAVESGIQGVVLSNHGGRSLDHAPAPIDILYELRATHPEVFDQIEVFTDGGIRRGTDVVKSLALGAKAVGLGRTFLYANGTYGEEGVRKAIQILHKEIMTDLKLLGCTSLSELKPEHVRRADWDPTSIPRRSS